jgi:hypothetical protein
LKQTCDIPFLNEGSADVSVGAARCVGLAQFFSNSRGVLSQTMLNRANPEELFVAAGGRVIVTATKMPPEITSEPSIHVANEDYKLDVFAFCYPIFAFRGSS